LDRNAVESFCGKGVQSLDFLQIRWCYDATLNTRIGSIFHPGVGYNGDLLRPFHKAFKRHNSSFQTSDILKHHANNMAHTMLKGEPDLVVVDSSLWDLAVWKERVQCGSKPCDRQSWWSCVLPCGTRKCSSQCGSSACACNRSRTVSKQRVQQWCKHDLPGLLERVKSTFPTSRIAFRTAPTMIDKKAEGHEWFTSRDIEMLYECVKSSMKKGKLFGKYEVIDYHAIVKELSRQHVPSLYRYDGYHPNWYASTIYVNAILRRVGADPRDPDIPVAHPDAGASLLIDGGRYDDDDFSATAADDGDDG
jgi:hypothetical protein